MTAREIHGPDLTAGVALNELADGQPFLGHVSGDQVLVVRQGKEVFAVAAHCSHVGAPLDTGLIVGDTVRCPWHHACFSLRDGTADCPPALDPLTVYEVKHDGAKVHITGKRPAPKPPTPAKSPGSVTIVGGGAAGHAAAEMLRTRGYTGTINLYSADSAAPYDRTCLSKFYLAGQMKADHLSLRPPEYYEQHKINLRLGARVSTLNVRQRQMTLASGQAFGFEALILALGAEPIRPSFPGASLPHVHTLRSQAQTQQLLEAAPKTRNVVIIGGSFIAMEAAAALRAHKLAVTVVLQEKVPFERVLGAELGGFMGSVHQKHEVALRPNSEVTEITASDVKLKDGTILPADLVLLGVGVRPNTDLAKTAGLQVDNGVVVDEHLQTNVEGIYSAGDNTCWADRRTGKRLRIEHWALAQRMGQTAARNVLGENIAFTPVPFFWTMQHGTSIRYVGHAEKWDGVKVYGKLASGKAAVAYLQGNTTVAVATVGLDVVSLACEAAMEKTDAAGLQLALDGAHSAS